MRLALYQPDIPPNLGTILRLCACLAVPVDVIEPCGFPFSDRSLRRAGLDYLDGADVTRHLDFDAFLRGIAGRRLVLFTTQASLAPHRFAFDPADVLLLGRETAGVPATVHARADSRLRIPLAPGLRSLNVAVAAGMVLAEALRQLQAFPGEPGQIHECTQRMPA